MHGLVLVDARRCALCTRRPVCPRHRLVPRFDVVEISYQLVEKIRFKKVVVQINFVQVVIAGQYESLEVVIDCLDNLAAATPNGSARSREPCRHLITEMLSRKMIGPLHKRRAPFEIDARPHLSSQNAVVFGGNKAAFCGCVPFV